MTVMLIVRTFLNGMTCHCTLDQRYTPLPPEPIVLDDFLSNRAARSQHVPLVSLMSLHTSIALLRVF